MDRLAHVFLEGESVIRKEGLRLVGDFPPPAIRLSIGPVFSEEGPVIFGSEQRGVRLLALAFKCDEMCSIVSVTRVTVGRVPVWHYCLSMRFIMELPAQSTATISAKTNSPRHLKLMSGMTQKIFLELEEYRSGETLKRARPEPARGPANWIDHCLRPLPRRPSGCAARNSPRRSASPVRSRAV